MSILSNQQSTTLKTMPFVFRLAQSFLSLYFIVITIIAVLNTNSHIVGTDILIVGAIISVIALVLALRHDIVRSYNYWITAIGILGGYTILNFSTHRYDQPFWPIVVHGLVFIGSLFASLSLRPVAAERKTLHPLAIFILISIGIPLVLFLYFMLFPPEF